MSAATASQHPGVEDRDETSDEQSPKRRERRKFLTSERAIAAVATALASYLVARTELAAKSAPPADVIQTLQSSVTALQATVTSLEKTIGKLEAKVDALTDSKRSFEDALSAYRLNNQNIEFRLGRVEADVARMPVRKQ